MKIFENASTRLSAQKFKSSTNVLNFDQMFMNVLTKLNIHFKLNIKHLLSSQNEFTLSKNMQNFLKMFNDAFKIINVSKLEFATSARNFIKTFENVMSKLNVHANAFI